ncbi:MAG: PD-(D/E)XK nuclease family protein [Verrucomicrobia bacterium]|nr:PD-(D/E)XK nuclease family protein [Verrucomicrobiota bacterium]
MNPTHALPEKFIRDLERVCATLERMPQLDAFIRDLDRVHFASESEQRHGRSISDSDLAELESVLKEIKACALERLRSVGWPDKLPGYDPLLSPISLFGTLDFGRLETAHTRTLAWLMNPNEEHGFGDRLLLAFLRRVFRLASGTRLVGDIRVESETRDDACGDRLDIDISGEWRLPNEKVQRWLVIIEAKIDADEGEDQCRRYEEKCRGRSADERRLVFLTVDGRAPKSGTEELWQGMAFVELMALFRHQLQYLVGTPGFQFLRLYMTGVLKDVCGIRCGPANDSGNIYMIGDYLGAKRGD